MPRVRVQVARRVRRSLLIAAAMLTVCAPISEAREPAAQPGAGHTRAANSFDVLQLNLCRNGETECRAAGDPVASATEAVRRHRPDVVTVNEICAHDITTMLRDTGYQGEFTATRDRTGAPMRCADGRGDYGIAILAHPDQGSIGDVVERTFAAQDGSAQQRVLLCAPFSRSSACTTNLTPRGGDIAHRQCRELAEAAGGYGERTVIGGDFHLRGTELRGCVPRGWLRTGDGGGQQVLATGSYRLVDTRKLPIPGTGHPGLLAHLTRG